MTVFSLRFTNEIYFYWLLISWSLLAIASGAILIRTLSISADHTPKHAASVFMFVVLAMQSSHAIVEGASAHLFSDLSAFGFFGLAIVFSGSFAEWFLVQTPLASLLVVLPLVFKAVFLNGSGAQSVEIFFLPVCGAVFAQFIATLKIYRTAAVDRDDKVAELLRSQQQLFLRLQGLERVVQSAGGLSKFSTDSAPALPQQRPATVSNANAVADPFSERILSGPPLGRVGLAEFVKLVQVALERTQRQYVNHKRLRFEWCPIKDLSWPLEVYLESEDFQNVLRSLLDRSVHSLGGGPGIVRVILQASVRSVTVTVEDNGRGLTNEILIRSAQHIERLEEHSGSLSLLEVKSLIRYWGGQLDVYARLGVGTRVSLILPRVDSLAPSMMPATPDLSFLQPF